MLKPALLTVSFLSIAAACGRTDKSSTVPEQTPHAHDAALQTVNLDGHKVAVFSPGDPLSYAGSLAEQDGNFLFTVDRAFILPVKKTLFIKDSVGSSGNCGATDYSGPSYMILRLKDDGTEPEIVRSTDGIEAGGSAVPATALSTFPGELDAGTYVITVDYVSSTKACDVKGDFTLSE